MCVCVCVCVCLCVCVCVLRTVAGGDQQMLVNYKLPKVDFICNRQPKYESCPFIKG